MSALSDTTQLPPQVLRDYALIADGERGALVGPHGDISWLCLPRWHDLPVFSALQGGPGRYVVTPKSKHVWGGHYEHGSLIWVSRWIIEGGCVVECREALARPASIETAVLLRHVQVISGDVAISLELDVRANAGGDSMTDLHRHHGIWTARSGPLYLRWSGAEQARPGRDEALRGELKLSAGQSVQLVLEIGSKPLGDDVPDAERLWSGTEASWQEGVPTLRGSVGTRDAEQAYAVVRGLTSSSGGMVAAATMGLPERADNNRSYDYRYVWIRDQCFAGLAAAAHGPLPPLTDAVGFATARLLEHGDQLKPAYTVDGGRVPDQQVLDLPGYPGGKPQIGNHVNQQFQLDSIGEILQLLAAAARHDVLDGDGWRAAQLAVSVGAKKWEEAEAGIWELGDDWWTESRLALIGGLRQIAQVAPTAADAAQAETLADAVLAETSRRCLSPDGYWQRSPGKPGVDASLLLPPVRGALPADDTRTAATLAAVRSQLVQDGYVYRFRPDARPLGEAEGAFLMCGFILAMSEHVAGNEVAAFRAFERTRAGMGSPGLLAEEFDVEQRQLRGNLPQAFVHATLLECAAVLSG